MGLSRVRFWRLSAVLAVVVSLSLPALPAGAYDQWVQGNWGHYYANYVTCGGGVTAQLPDGSYAFGPMDVTAPAPLAFDADGNPSTDETQDVAWEPVLLQETSDGRWSVVGGGDESSIETHYPWFVMLQTTEHDPAYAFQEFDAPQLPPGAGIISDREWHLGAAGTYEVFNRLYWYPTNQTQAGEIDWIAPALDAFSGQPGASDGLCSYAT